MSKNFEDKSYDWLCTILDEEKESHENYANAQSIDNILTTHPKLVERINSEPYSHKDILYGAVIAASKKSTECLKTLIKHGINFNKSDADNATPLHDAALAGSTITVELLLKEGLSPNANAISSGTPLHAAMAEGGPYNNTEVIKLLLDYGADPDIKTADTGYMAEDLHWETNNPSEIKEIKATQKMLNEARARKTANGGVATAIENPFIDGRSTATKQPERK